MYKGLNGQIVINDTHLTISRKGFISVLSKGSSGDKTIPIDSITAIHMKPGSMISGNGFIKFCFGGSNEQQGNLSQAVKDENAVIFRKKSNKEFEELKLLLEQRLSKRSVSVNVSIAGDIEKLARLKEQGHISAEEFEKAKNKALNL